MNSRNESLLDCPFCGNKVDVYEANISNDTNEKYWVECETCKVNQVGFYTLKEAIRKWNLRGNLKNDI